MRLVCPTPEAINGLDLGSEGVCNGLSLTCLGNRTNKVQASQGGVPELPTSFAELPTVDGMLASGWWSRGNGSVDYTEFADFLMGFSESARRGPSSLDLNKVMQAAVN